VAIVKLALSGLDGVEFSRVKLGSARVVYYSEELTAQKIVDTITKETQFPASLSSDGDYDPSKEEKREKCRWYQLGCG
jgi:hypothetical protein